MLDVHAILREVSVVDAQKLLATSRAEKAAKEKEMQAMGGSRYQDLIDAADQIVSMHEASQRLDAALRDMPQLWDTLESSVARTMATTLSSEVSPVISVDAAQSHSHSNGDLVDLVVGASERMWVAMEQGNPLEALSIFKLVDGVTFSDMEGGPMMGIVAFELDAMPSFQHRIQSCAQQCLRAPTKPTSFYERALLVLLELQHSSTAHALHSAFLQGRSAAAAALRQAASPSHKQHAVLASLELVLSTLNDAHAMFAVPTSALSTALADIDVHPLELACTDWTIDAIRTWRQDLVALLQSFHDVEAVASLHQVVQSQLDHHRHSNESMMVTWQAVRQALDSRKTTSHDNNKDADDLWSIFASDVFATCTQRLFAQAFDAAATALDAALLRDDDDDDERDDDMTATFVGRLVDIQHTGESSAATLQPVVASECIRVLFDVITTFASHAFPTKTRLLRLAQHCLNLNAAMPGLFQMSKPVVAAGLGDSWPSIEDAFATIQTEKATDHGTPWLLCSQLLPLFQALRMNVSHFEWLMPTTRLSPYHVYFLHLATIQGGAATGPVFTKLADSFCRQWVAHVVGTHGQPVLDALTTTRFFGYSNDVRTNSHGNMTNDGGVRNGEVCTMRRGLKFRPPSRATTTKMTTLRQRRSWCGCRGAPPPPSPTCCLKSPLPPRCHRRRRLRICTNVSSRMFGTSSSSGYSRTCTAS
ncbi:hypothetical protein, variant [Aphanomyces astaci]|uniref:Conserved oligomeric Golgi complex subunit 1 n=1 Tax=Aphanomyces astaci TaxID=112090 RepID=W4GX23_APHAT|nr:hypothetical protein, variant [Aphanomyces astaci]ETV84227.1 hypothetical protein, variant [Aphanomyces astaci]|eukprot:XP_009825919.1 hypothetical protein, variant [Aphanomyces astaci]